MRRVVRVAALAGAGALMAGVMSCREEGPNREAEQRLSGQSRESAPPVGGAGAEGQRPLPPGVTDPQSDEVQQGQGSPEPGFPGKNKEQIYGPGERTTQP